MLGSWILLGLVLGLMFCSMIFMSFFKSSAQLLGEKVANCYHYKVNRSYIPTKEYLNEAHKDANTHESTDMI